MRLCRPRKKADGRCPRGARGRGKGRRGRGLVTAVGRVELGWTYRTCPACRLGGFAADDRLGLGGHLTARARRLACSVGLRDSFERAGRTLAELAGWGVAAETIRRACHAEAAGRDDARRDTAARFAAATGDHKLHVDAGKVNTDSGWRDAKLACFARRDRAETAGATATTPGGGPDPERRDLPGPSIRAVIAAIGPAEAFGARCRAEADRLGLTDSAGLSVLGDGAERIRDQAAEHFAGAEQVLDVFHACGHLADLARAGFGTDAAGAAAWLGVARAALLSDGWAGACEYVLEGKAAVPLPAELEAAFPRLANYLTGHRDRLATRSGMR